MAALVVRSPQLHHGTYMERRLGRGCLKREGDNGSHQVCQRAVMQCLPHNAVDALIVFICYVCDPTAGPCSEQLGASRTLALVFALMIGSVVSL